jgi:hypothetical protein
MNVYEVGLDVRLKEYGEKRPVIKDLTLWVLEKGTPEAAIRKAKKWAMRKNGWDMGYPLSVKMTSVLKRGRIDVV